MANSSHVQTATRVRVPRSTRHIWPAPQSITLYCLDAICLVYDRQPSEPTILLNARGGGRKDGVESSAPERQYGRDLCAWRFRRRLLYARRNASAGRARTAEVWVDTRMPRCLRATPDGIQTREKCSHMAGSILKCPTKSPMAFTIWISTLTSAVNRIYLR